MKLLPMERALPGLIEAGTAPDAVAAARGEFRFGALTVYCRVGRRSIGRSVTACVQLANIAADGGDASGRGLLTGMVAGIRAMSALPVYVEGVWTPGLAARLRKLGFEPARPMLDPGEPADWILMP